MDTDFLRNQVEEESQRELQLQEMMDYYGSQPDAGSQENIVALLRETQEAYGYVPSEKIDGMADRLGVKAAVFRQLIKLYPSFKKAPYNHIVTVCTGPRCGQKGSDGVIEAVLGAVKVRENGYFKINVKECLKQCGTSPNIMVDGDLYSNVKPAEVASILDRY